MTPLSKEDVVRLMEKSGFNSWVRGAGKSNKEFCMELATLARADLVAENERLKLFQESALKVCAQLDEVVCALPLDYLDPTDGGDVSLGEQVSRMYSEVNNLRHECVATRTALAAAELELSACVLDKMEQAKQLVAAEADISSIERLVADNTIVLAAVLEAHPGGRCAAKQIEYNNDRLSRPRDDSALREMIAGVYDECAKVLEEFHVVSEYPGFASCIDAIRALAEKAKGE